MTTATKPPAIETTPEKSDAELRAEATAEYRTLPERKKQVEAKRERAAELRQAIYDHELSRLQREAAAAIYEHERAELLYEATTNRIRAMLQRTSNSLLSAGWLALDKLENELTVSIAAGVYGRRFTKIKSQIEAVRAARTAVEQLAGTPHDDAKAELSKIFEPLGLELPVIAKEETNGRD
jgi:hypothetical protein